MTQAKDHMEEIDYRQKITQAKDIRRSVVAAIHS
jgi:hypothetical protein